MVQRLIWNQFCEVLNFCSSMSIATSIIGGMLLVQKQEKKETRLIFYPYFGFDSYDPQCCPAAVFFIFSLVISRACCYLYNSIYEMPSGFFKFLRCARIIAFLEITQPLFHHFWDLIPTYMVLRSRVLWTFRSPSLAPCCLLSPLSTMSSLEEPLGLDKLPNLSSIVQMRQFSANGCRPRVDEMEMGNCLIEGRSCSSSNICEYVFSIICLL